MGTAVGLIQDRPCMKVYVLAPTEEFRSQIPSTVESYPVLLQPTGEIRARGSRNSSIIGELLELGADGRA